MPLCPKRKLRLKHRNCLPILSRILDKKSQELEWIAILYLLQYSRNAEKNKQTANILCKFSWMLTCNHRVALYIYILCIHSTHIYIHIILIYACNLSSVILSNPSSKLHNIICIALNIIILHFRTKPFIFPKSYYNTFTSYILWCMFYVRLWIMDKVGGARKDNHRFNLCNHGRQVDR